MTLRRGPLHGRLAAAAFLLACALPLSHPVRAEPGPVRPAADDNLVALDRALADIESLLLDAHFPTALGVAEATCEWADAIPSNPEVREARSRLYVLMSTAQIALGDEEAARERMQRALSVFPLLTLDERTTSPRVVKLLRELKASRRAARQGP